MLAVPAGGSCRSEPFRTAGSWPTMGGVRNFAGCPKSRCFETWETAIPEKQPQILRLTTPRLKRTPEALFAQDDN